MIFYIFVAAALVLSILAVIFQSKRGKRGPGGLTGAAGPTGPGGNTITFTEAATFANPSLTPVTFSTDLSLSYAKVGPQVTFELQTNGLTTFTTSGNFLLCDQTVPVAFRPTQNLVFFLQTNPGGGTGPLLVGSLTVSTTGVIQIWVTVNHATFWDVIDANSFSSCAFSWIS